MWLTHNFGFGAIIPSGSRHPSENPVLVTKVTKNATNGSVTKVTSFFINYFGGGSSIIKYLKKPSLSSLPLLRLPWSWPCWRLVEKAVTFVTAITTDRRAALGTSDGNELQRRFHR
jgi:hypothetical protein